MAVALLLPLVGGCALGSCGEEPYVPVGDGGLDGLQSDSGTLQCKSLGACRQIDLPTCPDTGGTASAGILAAGSPQFIGGPGATARPGDFFMQNDLVRLIVQQPGDWFSAIPGGGNIIDMDLQRAGEPDDDELGELTGFVGAMLYPVMESLEVTSDGSSGGPAVIEGTGRLRVLDSMNIPAVLGDAAEFQSYTDWLHADAELILPLEVGVRYALCPGEAAVQVAYTFFNGSSKQLKIPVGTIMQNAGESGPFVPGFGFGQPSAAEAFDVAKPSLVFGTVGGNVAYALRADATYNSMLIASAYRTAVQMAFANLTITAFGEKSSTGFLDKNNRLGPLSVPQNYGATYTFRLGVGRDLAAAQAAVTGDVPQGEVAGTVSPALAGARVAVFEDYDLADPDAVQKRKVISGFAPLSDGTFSGTLPEGERTDGGVQPYVFEADVPGYPRPAPEKAAVTADTPATVPAFTFQPTGTLAYNVTGAGQPIGCRVNVVGDPGDTNTGLRSNQFRDTLADTFPPGLAYVEVSSVCDSSSTAQGAAGELHVVPGRYRVVVSHGPEFAILEQVVDVTAGDTVTVTGDLARAVDATGWVAVDLHQHAWHSFDSALPHERRLTSYLAEDIDFFGSSEHDYVFDYSGLIDQMGYANRLATMAGTEISPMSYGHFNAFELTPEPNAPAGGSPAWTRSEEEPRPDGGESLPRDGGQALAPDELLTRVRGTMGAGLIMANHPRWLYGGYDFMAWFDRCGFYVDLDQGTWGCNPLMQPLSSAWLDLGAGATLWTDEFDLLEILNRPLPICRRDVNRGCDPCVTGDPAGRIFDSTVDLTMQDYFNLLDVGFITTIVGNSDSHGIAADVAGLPRTNVFVGLGNDHPDASLKDRVTAALLPAPTASPPRLAGAAVATNGPFVTVTVEGTSAGQPTSANIGQLVVDDDGTVNVVVHVEAPAWMDVDRIEVFANDSYDLYAAGRVDPAARGDATAVEPLLAPPERTIDAIPPSDWQVTGGLRTLDKTLTVTLPGPAERDAWIVVRVTGSTPLYPVLPDQACFLSSDGDPNADPPVDPTFDLDPVTDQPFFGATALALTNPVFVDRNGTVDWQAPNAP